MRIGALKETVAGEQRVAMTPDSAPTPETRA